MRRDSDASLSRRLAMRFGAFDGSPARAAKNSRGCGSKVITADSSPMFDATSRRRASSA
jgi:hypothetical protein